MDLYDQTSQNASKMITKSYSTSFSLATGLCRKDIRRHIYNIYGLVRIADEIVDGYKGKDTRGLLDELEKETYGAIRLGYSTNMVVHAFALTARKFAIGPDLTAPFFGSMRTDITKKVFKESEYRHYVYGSAEVIGLMCLKVFCPTKSQYKKLSPGAQALGAAFQKINFLRDFADDYIRLGRCYFPGITFDTFDDSAKQYVLSDIKEDISIAQQAVNSLPLSSRPAVQLALRSYTALLHKLERASPDEIKQQRFRVSNWVKFVLFVRSWIPARFGKVYR